MMTNRRSRIGLICAVSTFPFGVVGAHAAPGMAGTPLADRAAVITNSPAGSRVSFEVFLPLRNEADLDALIQQQQDSSSTKYHKWLTPEQFSQEYSPTSASFIAIGNALKSAGFTVSSSHMNSLSATGSVGNVNSTFGVSIKTVTHADGSSQLVSATSLSMPPALKAQGAVVLAFANRPNLHVNSHMVPVVAPSNRSSGHGPYWFTDLRQAYSYPALNTKIANGQYLDGTGVKVAIVMSSDALDSDVAAAFNHEKYSALTFRPAPKVIHVPINGGCTSGVNCASFGESSLDVQQVLGGAPGAQVSLLNIPSLSDPNIIAAYQQIVESNAYDVVSSSFGGCELNYSAAYNGGVDNTGVLRTYDSIFKQGNAEGITWIASSGDSGALSCVSASYFTGQGSPTFIPGVQFPANDQAVTGVGGGNLITAMPSSSDPLNSAYVAENAYGDPEVPYDPYGAGANVSGGYWGAGGGPSTIFSAPSYQAIVTTGSSTRTLPDVGMQVGGCPGGLAQLPCGPQRSAVYIYENGAIGGVIGTSVAAPEFAGALALYVQRKGRQGNLNPFLYKQGAAQNANASLGYYNRYIPGFDGKWNNTYPGPGYNYLVGNGTPRVRYLFGFTDLPAAGDPQTSSNP